MRGRRGLVQAGVVLAVGAVVGCTGGEGVGSPSPTMVRPTAVTPTAVLPTASTPPVRSPTSGVGVVVPKAARAHTYEGADAFARFYFAQLNKAWMMPDPGAIKGLSTAKCGACEGYMDTAEDFLAKKQRFGTPAMTITSSAWQPESTLSLAVVDIVVRQEAADVTNGDGSVATHIPRDRGLFRCDLRWQRGSWVMERVRLVVSK